MHACAASFSVASGQVCSSSSIHHLPSACQRYILNAGITANAETQLCALQEQTLLGFELVILSMYEQPTPLDIDGRAEQTMIWQDYDSEGSEPDDIFHIEYTDCPFLDLLSAPGPGKATILWSCS